MGTETGIEWTDHTFNPWWGCTKVSPGCANCYAERDSNRYGNDLWGPGKARKTFSLKHWAEPLKWNAMAKAEGRRHRVFCASMADVFEEEAPAAELARLWDLIRATPHLDWQLLTKRPHLIAGKLPADWGEGYANVWLGTSVEDQKRAEERIPHLVKVPARVRFLSCEPLLGPVNISRWSMAGFPKHIDRQGMAVGAPLNIHWIIAGGESGPNARPMHPEWVRSLRDQSAVAGAAFFFKQWGEWAPGESCDRAPTRKENTATWFNDAWDFGTLTPSQHDGMHCEDEPDLYRIGKRVAGRFLDGRTHNSMPA